MLICLGILLGAIFLFKSFIGLMMGAQIKKMSTPIATVTAMKAKYSWWQPQIRAAASLRAVRGVDVTSEVAGIVQTIYFTPGAMVQEGTVLVQLLADADIAALQALQAQANLALVVYNRDKAQYTIRAISKAQLDADEYDLTNKQALVTQQNAMIIKKTIRAPFTGRLGISYVNPGQFLNPGNKIVTLQTLDPIWVDFYVPQQFISQLYVGQMVHLVIDSFPNKVFTGKVTTVEPIVDVNTRNVQVEVTVANPQNELLPGMFASAQVYAGMPQRFITLPQTAISYNPYGDLVYLIKKSKKDKEGKEKLTANQVFITVGETRGDQIAILKGVTEGDMVVTSGQLKLKNGMQVAINNAVVPENNPEPKTVDQ